MENVEKKSKEIENQKVTSENSMLKGMTYFSDEEMEKLKNPFAELLKEHLPKQIVLIAVLVVVIIFFFLNLRNISAFLKKTVETLTPIFVGWVFAFVMAPIYNALVKKFDKSDNAKVKKLAKPIATIICTAILVGVGVGLVFLFVPQLYSSLMSFIDKSDGYLATIRNNIDSLKNSFNDEMPRQLFSQIEGSINDAMNSANTLDVEKLFTSVFNGVYVSFKAVLNIFVGIVVMIYSLNMKDTFVYEFKRVIFALFRKDIGKKIIEELRFTKNVFSGFLVGKIIDSLIIGIICYICCMIMGMPYTPLISVIVGITNIIPFFGPFIGAIPSFIIILLEGPFSWKPYGFLVFILILQQVDGNIIGPKILGDKTGVGSFWVLFSILLFGGLFGFVGMIIAVPMWAVITRLFDEFVTIRLKKKNYPLTTDEYMRLKEYTKSLNVDSYLKK